MTSAHHMVRNFVVQELPRSAVPLAPSIIARDLGLDPRQVVQLLDNLEAEKFFLFRNNQGEVIWAYPVTVATTPHKAIFSTGEQIFAA
ncbi:MAG: hypothetical protein KJ630_07575 [Proteobacteria bacterium]|nr:hypothetical protein [Pseudomonadota bacterium]